MEQDIKEKYNQLLMDLDNLIKTKNERDRKKVFAIVQYLKGNIKTKMELEGIVDDTIRYDLKSKEKEIRAYLKKEEIQVIDEKIEQCDSRSFMFHYLLERIDAKTRTIKEPNDYQAQYRDKRIEDAIQILLNR